MQFVAMSTSGAEFPPNDHVPPSLESIQAAFPQLEIIELIGQGGMGAVYKARQPKLDRIVALKILPLRLAREPLFADRFEREGRLLARLNHPNIVGVYDFGKTDGHYYLIMEYVDGVNLRQAFASARFTPQQALSVIPKICEALQFAHDEGVLHRDIKPENILLDTKGRVKIADFGIAKFAGVDDKTGLTATGATIGTPHYMAPEQVEQPANVDHRADIFSLGVVFYEMLTGELPLGRFSVPSERTKSLDTRIDDVVMRALEKDRELRQQSANEVRTQVELLSNSPPQPAMQSRSAPSMPPVLSPTIATPSYIARPTIAIALIAASLLLPFTIAIQYPGPSPTLFFWLGLCSAWISIPGTVLGIRHLVYLIQSGHRNGLKRSVVASMFWVSILFAGWIMYFSNGIMNRFSIRDPVTTEIVSLFALAAGVSLAIVGMWTTKKHIERIRPNPNYAASAVKGEVAATISFFLKGIALTVWAFFGLIIVYITPGTPSLQQATSGYSGSPSVVTPDLDLQIDSVSTKENVLIVVVKNGNPSLNMNTHDVTGTGDGMDTMGSERQTEVKLQVEFRGEFIQPEAQVLAAQSHDGKCLYPGEPPEIFSLSANATCTLAFAFPNSATAIACMNKILREQARSRERTGMGMGTSSNAKGLLFSINGASVVFGSYLYEAQFTSVR